MSYHNQSDPLQEKLRQLDEENTRLRNNVLACNDEIYSLKAVAATVEAELKYNTEQELAHMESELKFKSNDLAKLSRDYEKALKELAAFKQAQAIARRVPKAEPKQAQVIDDVDYGSYGHSDFPVSQSHSFSQHSIRKEPPGTTAVPIEPTRRSSDYNAVAHPNLAVASETTASAPVPLVSATVVPEKANSDSVSVSSSSKGSVVSSSRTVEARVKAISGGTEAGLGSLATTLQLLSGLFQRTVLCLLPVMSDLGGACSGEQDKSLNEMLQSVTDALRRCHSEVLAGGDCDFSSLHQAIVPVSECMLQMLPRSSSEPVRTALFASLESSLSLLRVSASHSIAQWGRLGAQQQQHINAEKEKAFEGLSAHEMAKVAGNLQSKFELAATSTAAPTRHSGNMQSTELSTKSIASDASDGSSHKKQSERVSCRVLAAMKTPYLSEAQRETLWGTVHKEESKSSTEASSLVRRKDRIERIQCCLYRYARLLEEVICAIGFHNVSSEAHLSCLIVCVRSWGYFYASLAAQPAEAVESLMSLASAAPRRLLERVVQLLLLLWSRTDSGRTEQVLTLRSAVVGALQSFLTCTNRGFAALCAHEKQHHMKGSGDPKRGDRKVKLEKEKATDAAGSGVITLDGGDSLSLLCALVALLKPIATPSQDLQLQIQVIICMENLLSRFGPRFVELLLGLDATAPGQLLLQGLQGGQGDKMLGAAEGLSGKKRHRSGSGEGSGRDHPNNNSNSSKPFGRNVSARTGSTSVTGASGESVSQITPSHLRKPSGRDVAAGAGPALEVGVGLGHRISPATGNSAGRSGRKLTPPTPYRDGVVQLDLQSHLASVQRALVSDLALVWMRLIRSIDRVSSVHTPSVHEKLTVVLIMRLNALLSGIFCHLNHQDCDFVLADVADTFHEYIFRSNSSSWGGLLKMPENLFGFLESTRNTDSVG